MSDAEFEALLALIKAIVYYHGEVKAHPNDQPRNAMMFRELDDAIEAARERLVL